MVKGEGNPLRTGRGREGQVEGNRERDGEGGNSKGKGIGKQTPEVNQISRAVDLRLQMEMYVADSVTEG